MKKSTSFVEFNKKCKMCVMMLKKKEGNMMPDHMLIEELFDELIDEISYIKLKAHLNISDQ